MFKSPSLGLRHSTPQVPGTQLEARPLSLGGQNAAERSPCFPQSSGARAVSWAIIINGLLTPLYVPIAQLTSMGPRWATNQP